MEHCNFLSSQIFAKDVSGLETAAMMISPVAFIYPSELKKFNRTRWRKVYYLRKGKKLENHPSGSAEEKNRCRIRTPPLNPPSGRVPLEPLCFVGYIEKSIEFRHISIHPPLLAGLRANSEKMSGTEDKALLKKNHPLDYQSVKTIRFKNF